MPPPILLTTESASELDAHYATWLNEYNPTTPELRKLILQAATTEWLLLRLQRQSDPILNNLFEIQMSNWTAAHHRHYQHIQRLLTSAETELHRLRLKILQLRRKLRAAARHKRQNTPPPSFSNAISSASIVGTTK
jgi:CHAD domain-containing protein